MASLRLLMDAGPRWRSCKVLEAPTHALSSFGPSQHGAPVARSRTLLDLLTLFRIKDLDFPSKALEGGFRTRFLNKCPPGTPIALPVGSEVSSVGCSSSLSITSPTLDLQPGVVHTSITNIFQFLRILDLSLRPFLRSISRLSSSDWVRRR